MLTQRSDLVGRWRSVTPGAALAAAVALVATVVGGQVPSLGAPLFAILAGVVVSVALRLPDGVKPGLGFASRRVLQASVVVLGLGLSLREVARVGEASLPVVISTLAVALLLARPLGRALGLGRDVTILIGVGTAICGASAIAAADSVIDAEDTEVSYAVATIFVFNILAVLTFPSMGHALGLSQKAFGLWTGTAVNDVSSVVAASSTYGHLAANRAVVVKLTRTLAIVPICLALAAGRRRRGRGSSAQPPATGIVRRTVPPFLLLFVVAVAANSGGLVPSSLHHPLSDLSAWMITAALAAIGLSTDPSAVRRAGARPLALGAALWAAVALTSLAVQAVTGAA